MLVRFEHRSISPNIRQTSEDKETCELYPVQSGCSPADGHQPRRLYRRDAHPRSAIPPALAGHDLIGTAQTGTGKTAAFVLPILKRLLSGPRNVTRALIVTPTRELAEQIHDIIRELAAGTRLRSATIYGGVGAAPQVKALREGVEILVACPGRLLDLNEQRSLRLDHVEVLVLDEADRMFDMGFLPSVRRILKLVPATRQTMLFSATFPTRSRSWPLRRSTSRSASPSGCADRCTP